MDFRKLLNVQYGFIEPGKTFRKSEYIGFGLSTAMNEVYKELSKHTERIKNLPDKIKQAFHKLRQLTKDASTVVLNKREDFFKQIKILEKRINSFIEESLDDLTELGTDIIKALQDLLKKAKDIVNGAIYDFENYTDYIKDNSVYIWGDILKWVLSIELVSLTFKY